MTERKNERAGRAAAKLTKAHTPEFPEQLGPEARCLWDRLMPVLLQKGHFKPGNEIGVVMICHTYAEWITAAEAQHKYGAGIKTKKGNFVSRTPQSQTKMHRSCFRFLRIMGLPPPLVSPVCLMARCSIFRTSSP